MPRYFLASATTSEPVSLPSPWVVPAVLPTAPARTSAKLVAELDAEVPDDAAAGTLAGLSSCTRVDWIWAMRLSASVTVMRPPPVHGPRRQLRPRRWRPALSTDRAPEGRHRAWPRAFR